MIEDDLFRVSVTAIVRNENGAILITRRHQNKKKWPGKWTVPGGGVTKSDFTGTPTTTNSQWYNVLINAVKREVKEETGLDIKNIKFLCDLAVPDTIIISFVADTIDRDQEVELQTSECDDYAWVYYPYDFSKYDLIEGIEEEILAVVNNIEHPFPIDRPVIAQK